MGGTLRATTLWLLCFCQGWARHRVVWPQHSLLANWPQLGNWATGTPGIVKAPIHSLRGLDEACSGCREVPPGSLGRVPFRDAEVCMGVNEEEPSSPRGPIANATVFARLTRRPQIHRSIPGDAAPVLGCVSRPTHPMRSEPRPSHAMHASQRLQCLPPTAAVRRVRNPPKNKD